MPRVLNISISKNGFFRLSQNILDELEKQGYTYLGYYKNKGRLNMVYFFKEKPTEEGIYSFPLKHMKKITLKSINNKCTEEEFYAAECFHAVMVMCANHIFKDDRDFDKKTVFTLDLIDTEIPNTKRIWLISHSRREVISEFIK